MHTLDDIVALLQSCENEEQFARLQEEALATTLREIGPEVHFRGLIEFSNICSRDCFYCGIRKSNKKVERYCLSAEEIIELAEWSAKQGYGSIALQSGERSDPAFIDFVEETLRQIKSKTRSAALLNGLGITLCVGEQTKETFQRFFDAGAHRYLLRIETTSPSLFRQIHPSKQSLQTRLRSLEYLKEIGYQTGTGVMIGLPGQTYEDLARDILFFKEFDIDMIGMGPYLSHHDTPMSLYAEENQKNRLHIFKKSLAMIAATRIVCPKINIAATTALQTIDPAGRIDGLRFGANVLMPQTTPPGFRRNYLLYEGKPAMDENAEETRLALEREINEIGRQVSKNRWGDSLRFYEKVRSASGSPPGK
ncbi:MAG: [FeFe] hydrogenase H-cluster radical SAM maturase HydE [Limisphaerales bacterium]|jgi:biotin synthase|nr:[FeFe] hydrogenase H-cluster radical SAM maturase HydE [Verrucomicrobiota bacterium]